MLKKTGFDYCPTCGRKTTHYKGGQRLTLTDAQIEAILRHYYLEQPPKLSQKAFCEQTNITLMQYWRVSQLRLKNFKDVDRVMGIAKAIGCSLPLNALLTIEAGE